MSEGGRKRSASRASARSALRADFERTSIEASPFPSVFKEGCPSEQKTLERSGGVVTKEPRSAPCLLMEVTNRPVCAAKERGHFLKAQPPRLGKAGNGAAIPFSSPPRLGGEARSASPTGRSLN